MLHSDQGSQYDSRRFRQRYGAIEFSKAWVAVEIAGTMRQWSGCLEA
jgi:hypothetical protein